MRLGLTRRRLLRGAAWLAFLAAVIAGPGFFLTDTLLTVAIAAGVLADGWPGALLFLGSIAFDVSHGRLTRLALVGEWIERLAVVGTMIIARRITWTVEENDSKLRAILASMSDVIAVLDADGTYLEIIPTRGSISYAWTPDLSRQRIADQVPPSEAERFLECIRETLENQSTTTIDYSLLLSGRWISFTASVSAIDATRVIWVARDMTARRAAEAALQTSYARLEARVQERTSELAATVSTLHEQIASRAEGAEALRDSEASYKRVFDQATEIICTLAPDGRVRSINPAFERTLGWTSADVYGTMFSDRVSSELPVFAAFLEAAACHGSTPASRVVVRSKSGGDVALEATVAEQVVRGVSVGFLVVARDVTESGRTEQLLRDSEERFRLLSRATSDAIYDLDLRTGVVWRGYGYEKLFGYGREVIAATEEGWIERIHPDERERIRQSYADTIAGTDGIWSGEYRFRRIDGTYAAISDRAYLVRDASGTAVRMLGAMMDVTQRNLMKEQLDQAKRASSLGRVAGAVAHEFNNVLMGIQPNVEVLQRRGPADLQPMMLNITRAVERGKRVTGELLRFTRPAEPKLQHVPVHRLLDEWLTDIRLLLGATMTVSVGAPDDLHVTADARQIKEVLTNLALNAKDAARGMAGTLSIVAEPDRSHGLERSKNASPFVHFAIRDNGSGILSEHEPHIFEPLFTTKRGGLGLGLAITDQVVSRHGGRIVAESHGGEGTTFHLFLPRSMAMAPVEKSAEPRPLTLQRVLLVEDEPAVASGIAALFGTVDVHVKVVHKGNETVDAIADFSPDAVILDVGLPDRSGVDVYLEIQQRWPDLPVLFSSGHADSAKLGRYLARPNVGFILKPYDFQSVTNALAAIVGVAA